jgi:hypothetical protein
MPYHIIFIFWIRVIHIGRLLLKVSSRLIGLCSFLTHPTDQLTETWSHVMHIYRSRSARDLGMPTQLVVSLPNSDYSTCF